MAKGQQGTAGKMDMKMPKGMPGKGDMPMKDMSMMDAKMPAHNARVRKAGNKGKK